MFVETLIDKGLVKSKSDYRRLIKAGAVKWTCDKVNWRKIDDHKIEPTFSAIVKIGRKWLDYRLPFTFKRYEDKDNICIKIVRDK